MRCPHCKSLDDRVVDSRLAEDGIAIRRRRQCLRCEERFTTFERAEAVGVLRVIKRSGDRESFDLSRIAGGVRRACKNRPVTEDQIQDLAERVEDAIRSRGTSEISSQDIGFAVLERLRELDEVAYVRFASVYRDFQDAADFEREVGRLLEKATPPKPGVGR